MEIHDDEKGIFVMSMSFTKYLVDSNKGIFYEILE